MNTGEHRRKDFHPTGWREFNSKLKAQNSKPELKAQSLKLLSVLRFALWLCALSFEFCVNSALSLSLDLRLTYDANPFLLSARQIEEFLAGKPMGFRTYDDLVCRIRIARKVSLKEFRFQGGFASNFYFSNQKKSFARLDLTVRRYFGRIRRYVDMRWEWTPSYLIRPVVRPKAALRGLSYSSKGVEASFRVDSYQLFAGFEQDDYVAPYDFYDSNVFSVGFGVLGALRRLRVVSRVFGVFARTPSKKVSPARRGMCYDGTRLMFGFELLRGSSPKARSRLSPYFRVEFEGERRGFIAQERRDLIGELGLSLFFPIGQKELSLGYRCKVRRTSGEVDREFPDYRRDRVCVGLRLER